MKIKAMSTRLRVAREILGRAGAEQEGSDEGFTLIELMVVLLIMAILLAIAIPTFLSVTGGAKTTAAQSNLANAELTAQAIYAKNDAFSKAATSTPTTPKATVTKMITAMAASTPSITFVKTALPKADAGQNIVQVSETTTLQLIILASRDGNNGCWYITDNNSGSTTQTTKIPAGVDYNWSKGSSTLKTTTPTYSATRTCTGAASQTTTTFKPWSKSFQTLGTTLK